MRSIALLLLILCPLSLLGDVQMELSRFRPGKLGVDRSGTLWAWSGDTATVISVPVQGKQKRVGIDERVMTLDADSIWGVAALGPYGKDLVVIGWNGAKKFQTPLPFSAGSVCWIDADRVALGPLFGKHRVVIWRLSQQTIENSFGDAVEVDEHKPGARVARATLLRYDDKNDEIVTVDAYYGDVIGYTLKGKQLRRATLRPPNFATTHEWLENLDSQHLKDGTAFRPLVWNYPTLALDASGTAWLSGGSSDDGASLAGVERSGEIIRKSLSARCPSVRFEMWDKSVLFFRDPQSTKPYCFEQRKLIQ
jgi:hypothetical protein